MSRRRADKLDSHSRQACRANGRRRVEIELDEADCYALDVLAAHYVISRSKMVAKLVRSWQGGPPVDPFEPSEEFEASLPDP